MSMQRTTTIPERNTMNIFVGNLSRQASEEDLRELFEPFGKLMAVNIIKDKFSNESKGFGFVDMSKKSEGEAAIEALNGKELKGQAITVNEARPKSESGGRRSGGFGGGRRGGGGGYGGGGRGGKRY
jgi:RNA recognition motif-containing protein